MRVFTVPQRSELPLELPPQTHFSLAMLGGFPTKQTEQHEAYPLASTVPLHRMED